MLECDITSGASIVGLQPGEKVDLSDKRHFDSSNLDVEDCEWWHSLRDSACYSQYGVSFDELEVRNPGEAEVLSYHTYAMWQDALYTDRKRGENK